MTAWLWRAARERDAPPIGLCAVCLRPASECDGRTCAPAALDLSAELAHLGRDAAREAWVEYGGDLGAVPQRPELRAWAQLAQALGLVESDRRLTEDERRVFVHAYRNELHVLACGG